MNLDIVNALRSLVTVFLFVAFIGIVLWAWSGARRTQFAEAARIPFDEEDGLQDSNNTNRSGAERSGK